ncbi:phospholipase A2-like [Myripristis murdjan]|uniref:phospholipase A2-like n=1 Tax=Myripristis murdjan TaxID=586833 RepID=UPI001175F53B|nr:phospholipase A2-like [Myripristis murdjan]
MISCTGNRPVLDYNGYGCWCGWGGAGTAVDELDRCCQAHDQCYNTALRHGSCRRFWDNPYTKTYRFQCDWRSKIVSCNRSNNPCEMFICECDRRAAMCFARSRYNEKYRNYPNAYCK